MGLGYMHKRVPDILYTEGRGGRIGKGELRGGQSRSGGNQGLEDRGLLPTG
jgi:hypothetical protein